MFGLALACLSLALAAPAVASAAWQEPVGGPQPINVASDKDAFFPSLASVGGVPHVAWREGGGSGAEIHVARLNTVGTAWELVGGSESIAGVGGTRPSLAAVGGVLYIAFVEFDDDGDLQIHVARLAPDGTTWERVGETDNPTQPINESASQDADAPSLTAIGTVPYVAWQEFDGINTEIRVARLNDAGTGWEQPVGGVSPINSMSTNSADRPSLTEIDGVPHVGWQEFDGGSFEIRVARLSDDETAWEAVGESANPSSPINQSGAADGREPSLTGIGGVPYIAWREAPVGVNSQVRVARLSDDETAWDKVAGGLSPINKSSAGQATDPSLTGIDGVPYVAWSEAIPLGQLAAWVARLNADGTAWEKLPDSASPVDPDVGLADPSLTTVGGIPYVAFNGTGATNSQLRVSRLEPEFSVSAAPGATGATLVAAVEAFGFPYHVGFEFGPSGFTSQAPTQATSGEVDLITQDVSGLTPSTAYDFRAFALAGVPAPRVLGASEQFTTDAAPSSSPPDTSACDAAREDLAAAQAKLKKAKNSKAKRAVRKARRAVRKAKAAVEEACR